MDESQFWELIGNLRGEVTEESLERLREALRALDPPQLVSFQARLEATTAGLAHAALRYPDGQDAVGDGLLALVCAVISAGPEFVADVARSEGVVVVDLPPERALELATLAREGYEDAGLSWPDDTWAALAMIKPIWAYIYDGDPPVNAFVDGVRDALAAWEASAVFAWGMRARGWPLLWCLCHFKEPVEVASSPGTRWRSRASAEVLEVDISIDLEDRGPLEYSAGVAYVRTIVDRLSHRRGTPSAKATFAPRESARA